MANKVKELKSEDGPGILQYFCDGCGHEHSVYTQFKNRIGASWEYNGNPESPTLKPSVLYKHGREPNNFVCHTFITNGLVQFLPDSTHWLAGKTVRLPDYPDQDTEYTTCDCAHHLPKMYVREKPAIENQEHTKYECMFCDPLPVDEKIKKYLV